MGYPQCPGASGGQNPDKPHVFKADEVVTKIIFEGGSVRWTFDQGEVINMQAENLVQKFQYTYSGTNGVFGDGDVLTKVVWHDGPVTWSKDATPIDDHGPLDDFVSSGKLVLREVRRRRLADYLLEEILEDTLQ